MIFNFSKKHYFMVKIVKESKLLGTLNKRIIHKCVATTIITQELLLWEKLLQIMKILIINDPEYMSMSVI